MLYVSHIDHLLCLFLNEVNCVWLGCCVEQSDGGGEERAAETAVLHKTITPIYFTGLYTSRVCVVIIITSQKW